MDELQTRYIKHALDRTDPSIVLYDLDDFIRHPVRFTSKHLLVKRFYTGMPLEEITAGFLNHIDSRSRLFTSL